MKKKTLTIATVALAVTAAGALTMNATSQRSIDNPSPIPSISKIAPASANNSRGDGGRLDANDLKLSQSLEETTSSRYVINDATGSEIDIPVTSDRAQIGVLSGENGAQMELVAPNGTSVAMRPIERDVDPATSLSKMGVPQNGTMNATLRENPTQPGVYKLRIGGGMAKAAGTATKSPVSVVVNDNNDLVLRSWLSANQVDSNDFTEIHAKVFNGKEGVTEAKVTASIYNEKGALVRTIPLRALKDGDGEFGVAIRPAQLGRIASVIINAKGTTADGRAFLRTGNLELISGRAGARFAGIAGENLTSENLEVTVNLDVRAEGRFHVRANLVTADGQPIAWAQDAAQLRPGQGKLTLRFDRSLLPKGGNVSVRDIELTDVSEMPGVKLPGKVGTYSVRGTF
jgi:hypothetical protein